MPRVLVVDDEVRMRELLYDALIGKGHTVSTAGTGAQALEMLKAQRPQLVLLDAQLSGLSALEIAQRIRSFDDAVPILFWKGHDEPEIAADELERAGVEAVVEKEWEVPRIVERLEQSLARSVRAGGAPSGAKALGVAGALLIIDDDPQIQQLLKMFFTSKGLSVLVASSGEEGLQALARRPVLVLLDINMPGMDGVMTLKKIKAAQPKLPVAMMSGGGEVGMAREALKLGAYDYISKPFSLEYLETVVLTKVLLGVEGSQ